jgi:uncharacterized protein YraI
MNSKSRLIAAAVFAASIVPSAALAAMLATALTDLNIRSGPGPEYPVIGVIQAQEPVTMIGCIEGSLWCQITYKGKEGWAYAQYLATQSAGNRVIISERRPDVVVPTVTYQTTSGAGIAAGAVTGAIVAGPVGAAVGGVTGAVLEPPQQIRTYVVANPVDPVYLQGEVVVGAGLPETVQLRPVPDYNYRYVYVNGQPVLVDPASRQIVYVYR